MTYQECLQLTGLKNTKQRKMVFEALSASDIPITAEELYNELRDEAINLSTIYRTLDVFEEKEVVKKTTFYSENKATFELKHDVHRHHLICVICKKITPISGCPLRAYEEELREKNHYVILDHQLEISGICPDCQSKMKS